MSHVFDGARWMSIPIGSLWALLVTNLYLLLLYTISPALLPVAPKRKSAEERQHTKMTNETSKNVKNPFLRFSFLTRTGFITFLAIIIAQPFNVSFFAPDYEQADKFATAIQDILSTQPLSRVVTGFFCCIMLLPIYFKYRVRTISKKNFDNDFEGAKAKDILYLREQLSYPTDHQHLARQILSADINAIRTSDFYFQKALLEYRIVLEEYKQFKKRYSLILTERIIAYNLDYGQNLIAYLSKLEQVEPELYQRLYNEIESELREDKVEKYEYWADPPFRTISKSASRNLAKETDLLQTLYPDN